MYRLKPNVEAFTVVDGTHAGKTYKRGGSYAEIPPEYAGKFEIEPAEEAAQKTKPATKKQSAAAGTEEVKP